MLIWNWYSSAVIPFYWWDIEEVKPRGVTETQHSWVWLSFLFLVYMSGLVHWLIQDIDSIIIIWTHWALLVDHSKASRMEVTMSDGCRQNRWPHSTGPIGDCNINKTVFSSSVVCVSLLWPCRLHQWKQHGRQDPPSTDLQDLTMQN